MITPFDLGKIIPMNFKFVGDFGEIYSLKEQPKELILTMKDTDITRNTYSNQWNHVDNCLTGCDIY